MTARYYYHTKLKRRDRREALWILSNMEFYVERRTIVNALAEYTDYYSQLSEDRVNTFKLKQMYPYFDWER